MTRTQFFLLLERLYSQDSEYLQQDFLSWSRGKSLRRVFTPNPEQVMLAVREPDFWSELKKAEVLLPDGMQLVRAAQRLHRQALIQNEVKQRHTGIDLLQWWLEKGARGEKKAMRTFLLGGREGVAEQLALAVDSKQEWCLGLTGYDSIFSPTEEEEAAVREAIRLWKPKVIWVAFGAPWQERWVNAHASWLEQQGVRVVAVCGGAFDILSPSSRLRRAPSWLQQVGGEWLFRLIQQPSRWRRQKEVLAFRQLVAQWER